MDREPMEEQVISKQRVAEHGEVLTGKREVNAMPDLVKVESHLDRRNPLQEVQADKGGHRFHRVHGPADVCR
jgi:hypothetical protein